MSEPQYDPVYLHARREACVVLLMFALALTWSVGNYYLLGSVEAWPSFSWTGEAEIPPSLMTDPRFVAPQVSTILGMPTWVFIGILLPWLVIDVAAVWFCYYYMADDDLGTAPEEAERPAPTA